MADPREVEWQCEGKQKIPSKKLAVRAARHASDAHGDRIVWYRCKHCKFYHIGNQNKQVSRSIANRKWRARSGLLDED